VLRVPAGRDLDVRRRIRPEVLDHVADEVLGEAAAHRRAVDAAAGALHQAEQPVVNDPDARPGEQPHRGPVDLPQRLVVVKLPQLPANHAASSGGVERLFRPGGPGQFPQNADVQHHVDCEQDDERKSQSLGLGHVAQERAEQSLHDWPTASGRTAV